MVYVVMCHPPSLALSEETPSRDTFVNVLGEPYTFPNPDEYKAQVVIFIGHDCPISNSYSKEIIRLCQEFTPKKVAFCVVYADADLEKEKAQKHAKDFGFCCPALWDPKMTLALKWGASVKPEAVVLSSKGELVYRGRIDNRYVDFSKRREQVTSHDLRDALEATLAGKPVAKPRVPAIGCDIDLPKKSK
jgi:hypothetical protein